MTQHTKVVAGSEYRVKIVSDTLAEVSRQVVNPKTGKGWQARKDITHYEGKGAKAKAMRDWLYR